MRLLGTPRLHDPAHAQQVRVERAVAGVLHPERALAVQVPKLLGSHGVASTPAINARRSAGRLFSFLSPRRSSLRSSSFVSRPRPRRGRPRPRPRPRGSPPRVSRRVREVVQAHLSALQAPLVAHRRAFRGGQTVGVERLLIRATASREALPPSLGTSPGTLAVGDEREGRAMGTRKHAAGHAPRGAHRRRGTDRGRHSARGTDERR